MEVDVVIEVEPDVELLRAHAIGPFVGVALRLARRLAPFDPWCGLDRLDGVLPANRLRVGDWGRGVSGGLGEHVGGVVGPGSLMMGS